MVKLSDVPFKKDKGFAYYRCFGNWEIAKILSRCQALIIKEGNALEKLILEHVTQIDNIDQYLNEEHEDSISVCPKKFVKKSQILVVGKKIEPDFMVFRHCNGNNECHMVELKDGCEFDTKSSAAEWDHLQTFIEKNGQKIQYTMVGHICCFNETNRSDIVKGFKNKITKEMALTGREFCELLNLDYDEILEMRKKDRENNFEYFLNQLLKDDGIKQKINEITNARAFTNAFNALLNDSEVRDKLSKLLEPNTEDG